MFHMQKNNFLSGYSKLIVNASWLLSSEVIAKASRLLVIFTLAASLTAIEYGTVMLALACHEIFKIIMRSGAGSQIIQCSDSQLPEFAKSGAVLQWSLGTFLVILQSAAGFAIAHFYENPQLAVLLCSMAGVYLFYPIVSIKVLLVQRANNMRFFSIRNAICITLENASIAVFALLDYGIMSVVYGKWIFVSLWLILFYTSPVKSYGLGFNAGVLKHLLKTSSQLFFTESTRALRNQADILIGAKLLSPEIFGVYSFAKTAGVNLGQSISTAFNTAVYPFLCDWNRKTDNANKLPTIYILSFCVAAIFAVQASLVSVYVPLIFKQDWQQEFLTISLLCLANIPIVFIDTYCNSLRSKALFTDELLVRFLSLACLAIGIYLISAQHLESYSLSVLALNCLSMVVFFIPYISLKTLFNSKFARSFNNV